MLADLASNDPADGQIKIVGIADPEGKMDPSNPNYVDPLDGFTIAKRQPTNVFNINLIIVVVCSAGGVLLGVLAIILGCMCFKRAEVALAKAQVDETVLMDRKFREKMGTTLPEDSVIYATGGARDKMGDTLPEGIYNRDYSTIDKSQPYFTA